MRAYFFGNFYLSSIQQGIQAQHCTAEMFVKYGAYKNAYDVLHQWADEHKTSILLNGGDSGDLMELAQEYMQTMSNPYPWALFQESASALNNAVTCVGIILPEKMYSDETKSYVRSENRRGPGDMIMYSYDTPNLSGWEFDLVSRMSKCGMAR